MMDKTLTELQKSEITRMYEKGDAIGPIAKHLHIGPATVKSVLVEYGILRDRSQALKAAWKDGKKTRTENWKHEGKPLNRELIMQMFASGKNPSSIARALQIGARRVRDLLISEGLLCKKSGLCESCGDNLGLGHAGRLTCDICTPTEKSRQIWGKYGLTQAGYDTLFVKQDGHCALCLRTDLVVDHCHMTGVVRGLLCGYCNTSLGIIDNDPTKTWGLRATAYLKGSAP